MDKQKNSREGKGLSFQYNLKVGEPTGDFTSLRLNLLLCYNNFEKLKFNQFFQRISNELV
jgi:hypothetical protein